MSFELLTPEVIITAVEGALGQRLTGLVLPLPSYINRVYELQAATGTRIIVKWYRPQRWSHASITDEHQFVHDCHEDEIPVVPPLMLKNETTLGQSHDVLFAVYPKRAGRQLEINDESYWERLGTLIARVHGAGGKKIAPNRMTLHPAHSTQNDVVTLCGGIIPERHRGSYQSIAQRIIDVSIPLFEKTERIRIHGDCHRGNILDRLEEGLLMIDFDDMLMGPPVQDLWLLLPDRTSQSTREIELFIRGYERFRRFDRLSLRCIESLRAMRMIYFVAWCGRQVDDFQFRKNFPAWGTDAFWQREINDLREQYGFINDVHEASIWQSDT